MPIAGARPPLTSTSAALARSVRTRSLAHQAAQPESAKAMASVGAKVARGAKWAIPVVAVGAMGVKAAEEFRKRQAERLQVQAAEQRRQQQFYESYGEGMTLEDLQRSVDAYEGRR